MAVAQNNWGQSETRWVVMDKGGVPGIKNSL